jgi:hypothetical protein
MKAFQTPDAKLDYMVNVIVSGAWPRFFFYLFCFLLVAFVMSILLGAWAGVTADTQEPSFLILSKKAQELRDKKLLETIKNWRLFALSIITSIATGIVGNILFAVYLQKWLSE